MPALLDFRSLSLSELLAGAQGKAGSTGEGETSLPTQAEISYETDQKQLHDTLSRPRIYSRGKMDWNKKYYLKRPLREDDPVSRTLRELLSSFSDYSSPEGAYSRLRGTSKDWKKVTKSKFKSLVDQLVSQKTLLPLNVTVGKYTVLPSPRLSTWITNFYHVRSCPIFEDEFLDIGKFCSIADGVEFFFPSVEFPHDPSKVSTFHFWGWFLHKPDEEYPYPRKGNPRIVVKNDVWIGSGAIILPGITIGNGAVIASRSAVMADVPDYAIVGGNPARILRYRFSREVIDKLLRIKWWDWSDRKLRDNMDLIYGDVHAFIEKHLPRSDRKSKQAATTIKMPLATERSESREQTFLEYLRRMFPTEASFTRTTPLISSGIISSFRLMEVLSFIEDTFGVLISNEEISTDNFDTVRQMIDLISSKK